MRVLGKMGLATLAANIFLFAAPVRADEPVAASEPRLLSETGEVTSVVDAFDKDDPFDIHLTLGFQQTWKHANIRRETNLDQPGLSTGGFVARSENVASYSQQVSTLNIGMDVGLFHDLALVFRLPLILGDSRELTDLDGSSTPANAGRLQDTTGQQVFGLPFKSPTRSGVDYISGALHWAIMNQQRDETKPTWVIGLEGRLGVGPALHACNENPTNGIKCPDPSNPTVDRKDAGISRAMNAVAFHTVFSRRYGYIEPYAGFRMMAEFAQKDSDFGATSDLKGSLTNRPPLQGTFTMGMEVIPWERREQFQRLVGDFRLKGSYVSPGREYSELFDALGSSSAGTLRSPNPVGYHLDPAGGIKSVRDPAQGDVYFRGITDQQAYGSFGAQGSVTFQAGEYVKFTAGLGITYNQSHLVTSADSCNPEFKSSQDISASGPCRASAGSTQTVTGIPNPNHRAVIDMPGRRFSVDDTTIVDLWLNGVVMF